MTDNTQHFGRKFFKSILDDGKAEREVCDMLATALRHHGKQTHDGEEYYYPFSVRRALEAYDALRAEQLEARGGVEE